MIFSHKEFKNMVATVPREVLWVFYAVFPAVILMLLISLFYRSAHQFAIEIGLLNPLGGWLQAMTFAEVVCWVLIASAFATKRGNPLKALCSIEFLKEFFIYYPIWGTVQQILFFTAWAISKVWITDPFWSYLPLVLFVVLFHFPNWFTMFSSTFIVLVFAQHMEIYHNVFAIGVAHGFIASVLEHLAPAQVSTSFSIWGRYIKAQRSLEDN